MKMQAWLCECDEPFDGSCEGCEDPTAREVVEVPTEDPGWAAELWAECKRTGDWSGGGPWQVAVLVDGEVHRYEVSERVEYRYDARKL